MKYNLKLFTVTVMCTRTEMVVTYSPYDWFLGRIYVNSHSDECSSQGRGSE